MLVVIIVGTVAVFHVRLIIREDFLKNQAPNPPPMKNKKRRTTENQAIQYAHQSMNLM